MTLDAATAAGASAVGLDYAFLVMLLPLLLAGRLLLRARRTYPRDVATAIASEEATHHASESAR